MCIEDVDGGCDCDRMSILERPDGVPVGRCQTCHQLWRRTSGGWARLGHAARGFPYEALTSLEPHLIPRDLLTVPYIELVKYVPLATLVGMRHKLELERPDLVVC